MYSSYPQELKTFPNDIFNKIYIGFSKTSFNDFANHSVQDIYLSISKKIIKNRSTDIHRTVKKKTFDLRFSHVKKFHWNARSRRQLFLFNSQSCAVTYLLVSHAINIDNSSHKMQLITLTLQPRHSIVHETTSKWIYKKETNQKKMSSLYSSARKKQTTSYLNINLSRIHFYLLCAHFS